MSEEKILEISTDCKLTYCTYGDPVAQRDVYLEYVEHPSDHWHCASYTNVELTKNMAIGIIVFLKEAFDLTALDNKSG